MLKKFSTFAVLAIALTSAAILFAQSRQPATMDDLLAEIRGLRADLAASSGTAIKAQLLVARLQLQEQRTRNVIEQMAEARSKLTRDDANVARLTTDISRFDEMLRNPGTTDRDQIREATIELAARKEELKRAEQDYRASLAHVNELDAQLAAEQARWTDFNGRLDAIEQTLPTR